MMMRRKRILLAGLLLLLVSQVPFAYRRFRLRRLNLGIARLNAHRKVSEVDSRYKEYRGVLHVHSFLGGHSSGSFSGIISAAQSNQLQFVIMTEHTEKDFDTAELTLKGDHGGVLFINGNELDVQGNRTLVLPGQRTTSTVDLADVSTMDRPKPNGPVVVVAYPGEFKQWDTTRFDGIEVYNVYTNARKINPVVAFFDVLWSHRAYPALIFANYYEAPEAALGKWDQILSRTRSTAVAGNDSHANVGVSINDSSGKRLLGLDLDPYETSFSLVRLHVLVPTEQPLTESTLLEAIRSGHCYVGFDLFGDTSGFRFVAETASGQKIQGDEVEGTDSLRLIVNTPVPARVVVKKDGTVVSDDSGITTKQVTPGERGIYRAEIYLPQLGAPVGDKPWIISNPIYVR
jgi:hypothetical protein